MERYKEDAAYREHVKARRHEAYLRHGEVKRGKAYERMILKGAIKRPNPALLERYGIALPAPHEDISPPSLADGEEVPSSVLPERSS